MTTSTKSWYHLVTAQIVYRVGKDEEVFTVHLNGIVTTDTTNLPAASLGKAQQAVQLHFHKRHPGVDLKVIDVVITNLTNLGYMTAEEFHAPPEGTELRVRPEDLVNPDEKDEAAKQAANEITVQTAEQDEKDKPTLSLVASNDA